MDPDTLDAFNEMLGRVPTGADLQAMELTAVQAVLQRLVELQLAGWMDTMLRILRDDFGFSQGQLAQFARTFRERTREQTAQPTEPEEDQELDPDHRTISPA